MPLIRHAAAAVLLATPAVMHPGRIVATPQVPAVGVALPGVAPLAVRELCEGTIGSWQVSIVGPRVKVSRGVPVASRGDRQRELTARVLAVAQKNPDAFLAADGSWAAFSDPETGSTYAYECASGLLERIPVSARIRRLAVSQAGDVAMLTDGGLVLSVQPDAQEKGWSRAGGSAISQVGRVLGRPVIPGFDAAQADDLAWYGRQLMIVARSSIFRLIPRGIEAAAVYEHAEPPGTPADRVEHAFTYKGLMYVLRADGCFDVLVGERLSPHLPRAACVPTDARGGYLLVDSERVSIVAGSTARASVPRASVYTVVLTGDTRLIAQNLSGILTERWVARVPVGSPSPAVRPNLDAGGLPDAWRQSFAKEMWPTPEAYERTLQAIHRLGWTPLNIGNPWNTAPGVAFRWRDSMAVHEPAGRSMSQLARDLYHKGVYDERQVNSIIASNAPLSRSFEARILKQGWRAVASGYPVGRPAPALLLPVQRSTVLGVFKRSSEPEMFDPGCLAAGGAPEATLTEVIRGGLPFVGALEAHVMAALGHPTRVEIRGDRVRVVPCPRAFGSPAASLLVIDGIKLRASKEGVATKIDAPIVWADVRLKASADPDWPVEVTTPGVVGYRAAAASPPAQSAADWLERILPRYQGRLVLPVTSLEMAVAIDASVTPEKEGRPAVTLMSAEVRPAKAMSFAPGACDSAQMAIDQRHRHEQSMGFREPAAIPRDAGVIAVAENAVDVLNSIFVTPGGERAWVKPNDVGEFVPVVPPLPSEKTLRPPSFLTHGTQVAALLLANGAVPGLLNKAELTWFDLQESDPFANQQLFTQLFGRTAVLNVSQRLLAEDSWIWLRDRVSQSADQILLVAAAPNINESNEGSPLLWKSHAPVNIIGIGAANADGSLPDKTAYKRQFVDLLAPGAEVPTVDHTGALGCINGTSFSTAYATAAIAMLMHRMKQPVPTIRARLFATAVWRDSYADKVKAGHLDIGRALDGFTDNVLTVDRGGGAATELLVEINDNARLTFTGTTFVGTGETTDTFTVNWRDILRLEQRSDAAGQKIYRLHAIVQKQYRIYQGVTVAIDAVAGVTSCRMRTAPQGSPAPDCTALRVSAIRDYVASMRVPRLVLEFP